MAHLLKRARDEAGVGMATALFVVVTVFMMGITWSQVGIHQVEQSRSDRSREQAVEAAEAGLNAAMSELTLDSAYTGGAGTLPAEAGEYEVEVDPVDPSDPSDPRRLVRATGWAPSRDSRFARVRRLEAQVDIHEADGFRYALFAGEGAIDGDNYMNVSGDVYGAGGVTIRNNTDVEGDVVSPSWVTTENNSLVNGDIRAGGDVTLENHSTSVHGSVYSGGAVWVNASVEGDVQASGAVTLGNSGDVAGSVAANSPPEGVRQENLPTFTWDAANYTPAPSTWSSAAAFRSDWLADVNAGIPYSGHHRITGTDQLKLDKKWSMDADVTIVSDGAIELSRDITNTSGGTVDLVIVSFSTSGISFTNNVTLPDNIRVLLFAPNGPVTFRSLKNFSGVVYGKTVDVDQNFGLTFSPPDAPGFSWSAASPIRYRVVMRVMREVSAA